jgi:hypothetical protein
MHLGRIRFIFLYNGIFISKFQIKLSVAVKILLSLRSASRSWYFPAEIQLILLCGAVGYAKIEFIPANESKNRGFFLPKMQIRGF